MKLHCVIAISICPFAAITTAQPVFNGNELLGRITDNSVTVNVAADRDLEVYFEYGTAPATYSAKTATQRYPGGDPFVVVKDRLQSNTHYYYRM